MEFVIERDGGIFYREEEKGKMTQCLWKLIIIEILCVKKGYICYIW